MAISKARSRAEFGAGLEPNWNRIGHERSQEFEWVYDMYLEQCRKVSRIRNVQALPNVARDVL
jgi:cyclopropane fatty-acyl-phospholipid synthase-like methyltransferase